MNSILTILFILIIFCLPVTGKNDEERPEPPVIKRVSVLNSEGHVIIEWEESPSPGISYYELNEYTPRGSNTIAGNISPGLTGYLHQNPESNIRPFSYDMRAVRISENDTTYSTLSRPYHSTIYSSTEWDSCRYSTAVSWTQYEGWGDQIESYIIYHNAGNGDFEIAGTVPGGITDFSYEIVETNLEYCFFTEAVHSGGQRSRSNISCVFAEMMKSPRWINADYATAVSNGTELSFTADPDAEITLYRLLRSSSPSAGFEVIQEFTTSAIYRVDFIDHETYAGRINYYLLEALNSCGNVAVVSNMASNIVLEAVKDGLVSTLSWNPYQEWLGGTGYWNLYRTGATGSMEHTETLEPELTSYSDDLGIIHRETLRSEFCYMIEAVESSDNPYNITGVSRSNTVCIHLSSGVFMPNAFTPGGDGSNDEFYPVILFTPEDYLFIIMDRLGNKVFESNDHSRGWNGKNLSGRSAREGVYIYYLRIKTPGGELIEKRGHVVLFKQ